MKAINTYLNDAVKDAKTVVPALKDAMSRLHMQYQETTHPKLRILDNLILLSLGCFFVQIAYTFFIRTKEPLNALLAGLFCSLGQFALAGKFKLLFFKLFGCSLAPNPAQRPPVRQLLEQEIHHRVYDCQLFAIPLGVLFD